MRKVFAIFASLLITGMLASSASAASPHVIGEPQVTQSGNTLTVTFSVAGLGNVPSAEFSLVGTVDVSSRCYTRKGNTPQAANKQETINVDSTATFPVRNGRTNGTFMITPLSTLSCPGGQTARIENVDYNLTIEGQGMEPYPITG